LTSVTIEVNSTSEGIFSVLEHSDPFN
jgi:hypothetical protein